MTGRDTNYMQIGGIMLFRPSQSCEQKLRAEAEKHLRTQYAVGKYEGKDIISNIFRYHFKFFEDVLDDLVPDVASIDAIEFLLRYYSAASKLEFFLKREGKLNKDEKQFWSILGPIFRRAVKYMVEVFVQNISAKSKRVNVSKFFPSFERIWACAEQLAELYQLCDQSYYIFPEDTVLEILPPGNQLYLTTRLGKHRECLSYVQERLQNEKLTLFEPEDYTHDGSLEVAFKSTIGVSFREAVEILEIVIREAEQIRKMQPKGEEGPVLLRRNMVISTISRRLGYSTEAVKQVLAGFSLSKENMESMEPEGRRISMPKQEYRAFRRGLFEVPYDGGKHFIFSTEMTAECLAHLSEGVTFKKLPVEWLNASVKQSLEVISNKSGKWFENLVFDNLKELGIIGNKSLKGIIGQGKKQIPIPSHVGEIDFLGYSAKDDLLVVAECKMVQPSVEMKQYRDDVNDFVNAGKKAYAKKFLTKLNWVSANRASIWQALTSIKDYNVSIAPTRVAAVLITLHPTIASYFIEDFPCVTLSELILAYTQN